MLILYCPVAAGRLICSGVINHLLYAVSDKKGELTVFKNVNYYIFLNGEGARVEKVFV